MSKAKTKIMHEAALRVLAQYESTGEPFSLFLSSWAFDQTHKILDHVLGRPPQDVQVRIGMERQVRILLQLEKLETVSVYRRGDAKRIGVPNEWPALSLTNDEWQDRVSQIAQWADLIVLFWGVTTKGLTKEVEIASSGSNAMKTVVITPAALRDIFMSELYKMFPRIAPLYEIPPFFALHPEFTPLLDRMKTIKDTDPKLRSKFIEPNRRLKHFPLPPTSGRFDRPFWIEYRGEP